MSQARLTLRPPPNVEFVVGYPGIPAGHERPHAEVRGTLELRLGAAGTKAKWVRVELKKVETLPGGGQANAFYDFVGQSPLKIWEADGEWALMHNQDFAFAIRIPESIPPTIALEKGAGIKYELTASLCVKGKKSFFFKKQDTVLTTNHSIIIDKHELHSTWPVYAQPESRSVVDDLLILTVDRTHTCYGPGDRVKVVATFRNDGISAATLRALEFLLKETIIYRAGPHATGKKGAPQVHVTPIGEQKVPVNLTIYQGQQHRAELGCFIPQTHTTTTVGAARHIDIAYSINVKAILATGKPLLMELPVTVSNWPRNMSIEAIRRIGHAPSLSLSAPVASQQTPPAPTAIGVSRSNAPQVAPTQSSSFNTAPSRAGQFQVHPNQINERLAGTTTSATATNHLANGRPQAYDDFGYTSNGNTSATQAGRPSVDDSEEAPPRRPIVQTNPSRRLTLANGESTPEEAPPPVQTNSSKILSAYEEKKLLQSTLGDASGGSGSSNTPVPAPASARRQQQNQPRPAWPSAEEEKQKLFENARQQALRVQAGMGNYSSLPGDGSSSLESSGERSPPMPVPQPAPAPKKSTPWPTAEEEKLRLFESAQNAVKRAQTGGAADDSMGAPSNAYSGSPPATRTEFTSSSQQPKSTGAQLYQHAMANVNRNAPAQSSAARPPSSGGSGPARAGGSSAAPPKKHYPTAEEEKAALRYYEAKRAVDRAQNQTSPSSPSTSLEPEEPIAYDALYPTGPSQNGGRSSHARTDSTNRMSNRSDGSGQQQAAPPSPPQWSSQNNTAILSAVSEKERLRQRYEAEDNAASTGSSRQASGPPPAGPPMYGMPPSMPRGQPPAAAAMPSNRPLTAAEEKALLRARMEAEDRAAQPQQQQSPPPPIRSNGFTDPSYTNSPQGHGPSRAPSVSRALPNGGTPPVRGPSLSYGRRSNSLSYSNNPPVPEEPEFRAPPPPPPLAPRPPVEYIQETQEEDARSRAEDHVLTGASSSLAPPDQPTLNGDASKVDFGLPFRPFSPFHVGLNLDRSNGGTPPPPPPLPPKVPV